MKRLALMVLCACALAVAVSAYPRRRLVVGDWIIVPGRVYRQARGQVLDVVPHNPTLPQRMVFVSFPTLGTRAWLTIDRVVGPVQ